MTADQTIEDERLQVLRSYEVLDSEPEVAFDRITSRLARLLKVPTALVSFVDLDRQWFKSCHGLDVKETDREMAFCHYTIKQAEVLVVPDATQDPRFAQNPLVTGPMHLRFYAGAPLLTASGHSLGSLCVIDTKPRHLTPDEVGLLTDLAAVVVDELELRTSQDALRREVAVRQKAEKELQDLVRTMEHRVQQRTSELLASHSAQQHAEERYHSIFENAVDGMFQSAPDGRLLMANPAMAALFGYASPEDLIRHLRMESAYIDPERRGEFLRQVGQTGTIRSFESQVRREDGNIVWVAESGRLVRDLAGEVKMYEGTVKDITRRKAAEEEVQRSCQVLEERVRERTRELEQFNTFLGAAMRANSAYSAAIRSSVVGVLITDPSRPDNPTVLINPAFEQITGYSEADVMGKNCRFLQGEGSSPEIIAEMRLAISERRPFRGLLKNYRKDGTPFWNELAVDPVFDEGGNLIHFIGLQNDVSERVEAQQALRASEARLKSILDNTTSVVYIKNLEGGYELVNRQFEERFGLANSRLKARADRTIFPLEQARVIEEHDRRVVESGEPQEFEESVIQEDGMHTYISVKFPMRDNSGKTIGLCGLSTDITARKMAEAALRQSEARKAAILEASLDAVITIDHLGRVVEINPATETIFGYREEQMLGQMMSELIVPAKMRSAHANGLERFIATGYGPLLGERLELMAMRADGSEFPIELAITRIRGEGAPMFTGHIRDITRRKGDEAALKKAKEEAERANTAKSDFLSRMSHELRTPLNAILGFSQLLQRRQLEARHAESVGFIAKAGRHLLDLVNEVLDLARIESGHTTWSPEPVSVLDVLAESLDLVRSLALERSVELHVEPESPHESWGVMADRQRLKQIFVNLLTNAIKYNREYGRVTIRCAYREQGKLAIDFQDTGLGIPEAQIDRLFVPFDRLDAEKSGIEGTGIGLALSRRLAIMMGGAIEVESTVHEGSTFTVLLPRVALADKSTAAPSACFSLPPLTQITHKVLYVEDHPANICLMEHVVAEHGGIQLITSHKGMEAVRLALEHEPDLILLDLHLPDMPGDKVLKYLRAEPALRETPILIVSADAMNKQISRLLAEGATGYVVKPIEVEGMLQHFREHLEITV